MGRDSLTRPPRKPGDEQDRGEPPKHAREPVAQDHRGQREQKDRKHRKDLGRQGKRQERGRN
jgi:hypothetical protein